MSGFCPCRRLLGEALGGNLFPWGGQMSYPGVWEQWQVSRTAE